MGKLLNYICIFILCAGSIPCASAADKEDAVIASFRESFGFDYLTKAECDSLSIDSLLPRLDAAHRYRTFFELERILIKSYLFRGEIRLAIAYSDRVYSKAHALSHPFGTALALHAMGEVYVYSGRLEEAGEAYEKALNVFQTLPGEEEYLRMLLVEMVEYNLRIGNKSAAARYLHQLNSYPVAAFAPPQQAACYVINVYYHLFLGDVAAARPYMDKIARLSLESYPYISQYLRLVRARYLMVAQQEAEALQAYDEFLQTDYAHANSRLYMQSLHEKADLLFRTGEKEEAYKQYGRVFASIKSAFDKNYPREISQLTTRFQADRLAYQNEYDRIVSMRFYLVGVVVCSLALILFLAFGWKKIFRLKRSRRQQEAMRQKAERAIRRKNMFLSNMSHEVRTPLNAIVGFSAVLTSEDESFDDDSRKEFCEIIKVNSFQLLKLINDILDISDFENDNIDFNIRLYDAVKLCRETVETVIASRKLQVEMRFESELRELPLEADDSRLRQVLINLLVNAAKFTEKGSIVLRLELADEDTALFSVTDTGCGIPLEKQQLIFERFEKLNDFVQGSGLGLSICRLIITHMHGRIWVDSTYTEGTRFYFTHPLKYVAYSSETVTPSSETVAHPSETVAP